LLSLLFSLLAARKKKKLLLLLLLLLLRHLSLFRLRCPQKLVLLLLKLLRLQKLLKQKRSNFAFPLWIAKACGIFPAGFFLSKLENNF